MRFLALVAALTMAFAVPAFAQGAGHAQWHRYVNKEYGFAVDMPGKPVMSKGTYRTGILGTRPATIFTTMDQDVKFTVTIVNTADVADREASILQELIYIRTRDRNIVADNLARAEPGKNAVYGRRVTEDKKDGSRVVGVFYLTRHKLYLFEATVLPGGDKRTPLTGHFVDTVQFDLKRDWDKIPGGGEAPAPHH